ncbi:MAG: glycosyltransferase, partial [Hymenobacteraceae bacterium]|nr:glycosyltransferase [Hymenobacteraceae bacterium]
MRSTPQRCRAGGPETLPAFGGPRYALLLPRQTALPFPVNTSTPAAPLRVIISGGGTGGHIYPAVAIANEIRARHPDAAILFVGALGRMEMVRVPEAGYEIKGLRVAGLQRRLTLENLAFPFKLIGAVRAARHIVQEFRPDVVVGVGGYASAPTLLAATNLSIPTLIQEQNSYAGLTNKLLGKRADRICVAYEGMERFFPKEKLLLTGNPVRSDILSARQHGVEAAQEFGLAAGRPTVL